MAFAPIACVPLERHFFAAPDEICGIESVGMNLVVIPEKEIKSVNLGNRFQNHLVEDDLGSHMFLPYPTNLPKGNATS